VPSLLPFFIALLIDCHFISVYNDHEGIIKRDFKKGVKFLFAVFFLG
jgi:hypothetical protein